MPPLAEPRLQVRASKLTFTRKVGIVRQAMSFQPRPPEFGERLFVLDALARALLFLALVPSSSTRKKIANGPGRCTGESEAADRLLSLTSESLQAIGRNVRTELSIEVVGERGPMVVPAICLAVVKRG